MWRSAMILAAALAVPAGAQVLNSRTDDELFKDVSTTVLAYPQFTIFDDVARLSRMAS